MSSGPTSRGVDWLRQGSNLANPSSHPLDGARLKVKRAKRLLGTLSGELATLRPPSLDQHFDRQTRRLELRAVRVESPSPESAILAGDFVQCLRAALNYVAWELAALNLKNHGERRDPDNATQFPIETVPGQFSDRRVRDISAEHVEAIKAVQPNQVDVLAYLQAEVDAVMARHERKITILPEVAEAPGLADNIIRRLPLARLQELSNTDKHRSLQVGTFAQGSSTMQLEAENCEIGTPNFNLFVGLSEGQVLVSAEVLDDCQEPRFSVLPEIELSITFGGAGLGDFAAMTQAVESIVEEFASAFPE